VSPSIVSPGADAGTSNRCSDSPVPPETGALADAAEPQVNVTWWIQHPLENNESSSLKCRIDPTNAKRAKVGRLRLPRRAILLGTCRLRGAFISHNPPAVLVGGPV